MRATDIYGFLEKIYSSFYAHRFAIGALAFVTLYLSWPAILSKGIYPSGIDAPAHFFKVNVMQNMVQTHGTIFQWSSSWYSGYPFLTLYAPFTYYMILMFNLVFSDSLLAFNIFRVLILFSTGFMSYFILREEIEKNKIALFGGILALTAVPIHNNIFGVGRIPYATGLVVYLVSVYFLLKKDIYTDTINKFHLMLAASLILLVITHPMAAYFLAFTALVFPFIYSERIKSLGVRPIILVTGIVAIFSLPYLTVLVKNSFITDPIWFRSAIPENLALQVSRNFTNIRPRYLGAVHVGLIIVGMVSTFYKREKFKTLAIFNFVVFYTLFWSYNLGILHYLPLHSQFGLPRFEVMFILWGSFIAAYGLKEFLSSISLNTSQKQFVILGLTLLVLVDVAPLTESTQNWSPKFDVDEDYGINESYRSMMVGTRHWDDYILPVDFNTSNTFGWFQQADPYYNFSQTLQNTGGVWYPGDKTFPRKENSTLRKNLMWLSNTKYIIFAKKNWSGAVSKKYVVGDYYEIAHRSNEKLYKETKADNDFKTIYRSDYLEIFEFRKDMSYCESVKPIWVSENYFAEARSMLSNENTPPEVPVDLKERKKTEQKSFSNSKVKCFRSSPTNITVESDKPAWVLVKESYYPYWYRSNGKPIYNAFGFIVTHVNGRGEIIYDSQRTENRDNTIRS